MKFDHLHTSITTYEAISTRQAVAWVHWWYEFIVQHMGVSKSDVSWSVQIKYRHEVGKKKSVPYNKIKWDEVADRNEPIDSLSLLGTVVNYQEDNFPFLCNITVQIWNTPDQLQEWDRPEIANVLSCSIDTKLFARKIIVKLQQEVVAYAATVFIETKAITGHITYNWYGYAYGVSPYEEYLGYTYPEVGAHFRKHLRGCYWSNFLCQEHVELLGGLDYIIQLPVARVEKLNQDSYYIQLTEDINVMSENTLFAMHNLFASLFLPPKRILPGRTIERYILELSSDG